MCIEDLLEEAILSALMCRYGTTDRIAVIDVLWLRAKTLLGGFVSDHDLVEQIVSDLHLPVSGVGIARTFSYDGYVVSLTSERSENSLIHIVESWQEKLFRNRRLDNGTIMTGLAILNDVHKEIMPKKKRPNHQVTLDALDKINQRYNLCLQPPCVIEKVEYPEHHTWFERTVDEKLISNVEFIHHRKVFIPSEADLEAYIIHHLEEIEPGLQLVEQQGRISHGRFDLLVKDASGLHVLMELKVVSNDSDLLRQVYWYPIDIARRYKEDHVRTVVIAPSLSEEILVPLRILRPEVEVFEFTAKGHGQKIESVTFTKLPILDSGVAA